MVNDPVADLLTRLRNASQAGHRFVEIPNSRMKKAIVVLLKAQGFVEGFLEKEDNKQGTLRVYLKYDPSNSRPVLQKAQRISSPGRRQYVGYKDIPRVRGGMGIAILSTSQGIMIGTQAKRQKLGGELLCQVW